MCVIKVFISELVLAPWMWKWYVQSFFGRLLDPFVDFGAVLALGFETEPKKDKKCVNLIVKFWISYQYHFFCFQIFLNQHKQFSNFSCMFLNNFPIIFPSRILFNYSNLLDMRNLLEQVKKAFCCQKFFWTFTGWRNCSSDL